MRYYGPCSAFGIGWVCVRLAVRKRDQLCTAHYQQAQDKKPFSVPRIFSPGRACKFQDCDRPHIAKGWCIAHYQQVRASIPMFPAGERVYGRPSETRDHLNRKQCVHCEQWKPESEFSTRRASTDGLNYYCQECAYSKHLRRVYKLEPATFKRLFQLQGGVCRICSQALVLGSGKTVVDHDHSCCPGKVTCGGCIRGILCSRCNTGIGFFSDNASSLRSAMQYLEEGVINLEDPSLGQ